MKPESASRSRLVYCIDEADRLCAGGESMPAAVDAGAPEGRSWMGRPLWDFIQDRTVVAIYRQMVRRARDGNRVRFCYRCDSPGARRLYLMEIRRTPAGLVEFANELLREQPRPRVEVLDPAHGRRSAEMLTVCSWCERAMLGDGRWVPIEEAVDVLELMQREAMPQLTHGICARCADRVRRSLSLPGLEQPTGPQPAHADDPERRGPQEPKTSGTQPTG